MKFLQVATGMIAALLLVCGLWAGMGFTFKLAYNLFMLGWNMI